MVEVSVPSFDFSKSSYTLSIRLVPDGFCFAVFDAEKRLAYYASSVSAKTTAKILGGNYLQACFLCDAEQYTLLPRPAFRPELQDAYWKLNFSNAPAEPLAHDDVRLTDIVNLYALPKQYAEIADNYPQLSLRPIHRQSIQTTMAVMRNKQDNNRQLFIHLMENSFDVLLLDRGSVVLCNTYANRNDDELLYFALNVFNQMKLDPYATEVRIAGSDDGHEQALFSKYVENVVLAEQLQRELPQAFRNVDFGRGKVAMLNLPFAL